MRPEIPAPPVTVTANAVPSCHCHFTGPRPAGSRLTQALGKGTSDSVTARTAQCGSPGRGFVPVPCLSTLEPPDRAGFCASPRPCGLLHNGAQPFRMLRAQHAGAAHETTRPGRVACRWPRAAIVWLFFAKPHNPGSWEFKPKAT